MAILGLLSTESVSTERFTNVRRKVFYFYPNGAAPLIGLLSMMKEEDTDDPEFSWYEKRLSTQATTTANITSNFLSTDPANTAAGAVSDAALSDRGAAVITQSTIGRMKVTSTGILRVGHIIKIAGVATASSGTIELKGVVTFISTSVSGAIDVRWINPTTGSNVSATQTNNLEVLIVGSSFAQGITDISRDIYNIPTNIGNYAQIFRAPFSITGTALKTSVKFDETGTYKDKAKEASVDHMREIEKCFIFGEKAKIASEQVSGLPAYTTGGILYFLNLWEAGTTYGNTAATLDTDDNKRIITNASGKMNSKTYNGYLERVFRVTNNVANEKLVLCGSGFLNVINQMYENRAVLTTNLPFKDTFGMNVVKHETPFGTIYYKSHPLFSQNPTLRFNALFVDVQNIKYRFVQGRDTELLKNRQPNDADYRKDEWLTECGMELQFPESCMYLQNVTDFTP